MAHNVRLSKKSAAFLVVGAFVFGALAVGIIGSDGPGIFSSLPTSPPGAGNATGSAPPVSMALPDQPTGAKSRPGMPLLTLPQGGYISKRLLGCWHGTTAPQPAEWRLLSPLGALVAYHSDNIDICLTWDSDNLKVTDSRWSCAGCSYSPGHRSSYRVLSATGDRLAIEMKDFAGMMRGNSSQDLKLNQDDSIDERDSYTGYMFGLPAVHAVTTAHLERKTEEH